MKIILLIFFLFGSSECARILGVFPFPSISHQVVFHAFVRDLAARGHQLTILTTDLMKTENPNVTQIDLHDSYNTFQKKLNFVQFKDSKKTELELFQVMHEFIIEFLEEQLSHPEVEKLIIERDSKQFDLVIFEHLNFLPWLAFAEIYDVPAIGMTSFEVFSYIHESFGNVVNPAIHPEVNHPFIAGSLTFYERWESLKLYLSLKFVENPTEEEKYEKIVRKHFPMVKSTINQLKERIQLFMTNTSPAMGFIRPLLPNTIQLGFMHIETAKPLPSNELKSFLDNSKNGVIYMSLGSNVKSKDLSSEVLQTFLKVFGSLSYDVLWKFEADNLPNKPENVMISKWTPQSDLLAHPKIKVFITQGGQQSMEEAIDRTVPLIVVPFISDQCANALRLQQIGVGYILQIHSLTADKLQLAIAEMVKPKYKKNIKQLRTLVNDQPMTSRERAVWWTEYVIRHKGAKHLEYPGRLVPFYQKYWLDFIGIGVFVSVFVLTLVKSIISGVLKPKKIKRE